MTTANPRAGTIAAYQSAAAHGAVAAADPHRLIALLIDGALDRIAQARGHIQRGELAQRNALLHTAVNIIDELRASLDLKAGGEIAANLDDLYDYMCRRLVRANLDNSVGILDEVAALLGEVRSAWAALPPQAHAPQAGAR